MSVDANQRGVARGSKSIAGLQASHVRTRPATNATKPEPRDRCGKPTHLPVGKADDTVEETRESTRWYRRGRGSSIQGQTVVDGCQNPRNSGAVKKVGTKFAPPALDSPSPFPASLRIERKRKRETAVSDPGVRLQSHSRPFR